jgi:D-lyxose ketol-isomerase
MDKLLVIVAPCIPPYMAKDVPGLDLSPEGIGMITRAELESARKRAAEMLKRAGIVARQDELEWIEVVDFGLSELEQSGVQILTLVDTEQIAAKVLVLFPDQTEPEHTHPRLGDYLGKEETIRCQWGELYAYGPGEPTPNPKGHPPDHRRHTYTVWHETVLRAGDQITFSPDTPHWFQGGPEGAVFWSFSTKAIDVEGVFTDPNVQRTTVVVELGTWADFTGCPPGATG